MSEKFILYVGLNDKDTKTQLVNTLQAKENIADICGNCTISEVYGAYIHDDGTKVKETTLKVELLFISYLTAVRLAKDIKRALNQESIALERVNTDSTLI